MRAREISAIIEEKKVIAICRRVFGSDLLELVAALRRGGLGLVEVTFDQAAPDCERQTAEAIARLVERFPDMEIGAGTVLSVGQVEAAADAGATYIISPNTNTEVIRAAKRRGLVSIPGAMTPSEIMTAHDAGADFVKLFPAGALGFPYIRDILAPISHVKLVATGGVNEENLPDYLKLGFTGAGVSGRLCDKKLLAAGDFDRLTQRARTFSELVSRHQHQAKGEE